MFVGIHGVWLDRLALKDLPETWSNAGIPARVVQRAVAYNARWGGLCLPPALSYDGGPHVLDIDTPEPGPPDLDWRFDAGSSRTALPYGFMIGPDGSFGIEFNRWIRLHTSIEGWIESLAFTYAMRDAATTITKVTGDAVDELDLTNMNPVPEVRGVADTWWRGDDSAIAIYQGEAELFQRPAFRTAYIHSGLPGEQPA